MAKKEEPLKRLFKNGEKRRAFKKAVLKSL